MLTSSGDVRVIFTTGDWRAEIIDENLADEACVEDAVSSCPAECIHVDEE